jgi:hypothetical protein
LPLLLVRTVVPWVAKDGTSSSAARRYVIFIVCFLD